MMKCYLSVLTYLLFSLSLEARCQSLSFQYLEFAKFSVCMFQFTNAKNYYNKE